MPSVRSNRLRTSCRSRRARQTLHRRGRRTDAGHRPNAPDDEVVGGLCAPLPQTPDADARGRRGARNRQGHPRLPLASAAGDGSSELQNGPPGLTDRCRHPHRDGARRGVRGRSPQSRRGAVHWQAHLERPVRRRRRAGRIAPARKDISSSMDGRRTGPARGRGGRMKARLQIRRRPVRPLRGQIELPAARGFGAGSWAWERSPPRDPGSARTRRPPARASAWRSRAAGGRRSLPRAGRRAAPSAARPAPGARR